MEERKNANTQIRTINYKKLAYQRKLKIFKLKVALTVTSIGCLASLAAFGSHVYNENKFEPTIPDGYYQTYMSTDVERGDTLTSIASLYFDEELYGDTYKDLNDYIDSIAKTNHVSKNHINPYQSLNIPVLVAEDNIYVQQINSLEKQIAELDRWVPYTVQAGDTLLALAYQGAGTTNEAYELQDEIRSKNDLDSSTIIWGDEIKIINPEIGRLKKEVVNLKEKLHESLQVEQNKTK